MQVPPRPSALGETGAGSGTLDARGSARAVGLRIAASPSRPGPLLSRTFSPGEVRASLRALEPGGIKNHSTRRSPEISENQTLVTEVSDDNEK